MASFNARFYDIHPFYEGNFLLGRLITEHYATKVFDRDINLDSDSRVYRLALFQAREGKLHSLATQILEHSRLAARAEVERVEKMIVDAVRHALGRDITETKLLEINQSLVPAGDLKSAAREIVEALRAEVGAEGARAENRISEGFEQAKALAADAAHNDLNKSLIESRVGSAWNEGLFQTLRDRVIEKFRLVEWANALEASQPKQDERKRQSHDKDQGMSQTM